MDVIQDEMERMSRLLGDLLLLARADTGGLPLQIGPVELDNVLFSVPAGQAYREPVSVELTAVDQATILGDEDRLKQLLLNMVDNGIKYTLPGGTVRLSLTKGRRVGEFDHQRYRHRHPARGFAHIFDRFYRGRTRRAAGHRVAQVWGWPSPNGSSRPTAARSGGQHRRPGERPSASRSPQ